MATVNKDFKIKNGLIVEGANGTINGYDILTKDQADQNYIIGLIGGSATSNATANAVVLRDGFANFAANVITADLVGDVTGQVSDISNHDTDDLSEGTTNRYFSNSLARGAFVGGTGLDYDSASGTFDIDSTVTTNTGNQTLENKSISGSNNTLSNIPNAALDNDSITVNGYSTALGSSVTLNTDDVNEGLSNLYFSNTLARGAVDGGDGLNYNPSTGVFDVHAGNGLEININGELQIDDNVVVTETDLSTAISTHNASSGVHGVTGNVVGTTDTQTVSNKTLGSDLDADGYTITNLGTPNNANDAATKAYVDAVSEGLHIHASAQTATIANIALSPAPASVDGVTLTDQMRVLVKNQSSAAENGIYVFSSSTGNLTRAIDFDSPAEVDGGDFIFVTGGNTNDNTGWVQTSTGVATIGTDPIYFTQFSGAGEYLAGNGLQLAGNEFSIDTAITATVTYVNTEIGDHSDLITGVHGVTGDVVGTSDTQTLTNKVLGSGTDLGADLDAVNSYKIVNLQDPTSNQDAATKYYVDTEVSGVAGDLTTHENATTGIHGVTGTVVGTSDSQTLTNKTIDASNNTLSNIGNGSLTNSSIEINGYNTSLGGSVTLDTDDVSEGTSQYFTNARAEAAMVTPLTTGTQTNITVTYDNISGTYDFVAENGVADSNTDQLTEGSSNLYFTNARAVAALEAVTPNFVEIDINSVATQVAATLSAPTAGVQSAYSWDAASYRSAEFLVKVAYGSHTEISKVMLTLDSSDNIAITEYAIVGTNGSASSISATVSSGDVVLQVTTVNNNSTVTVVGTLLV